MTALEPIGEMLPKGRSTRRNRGLSPDDAVLTDAEELVLDLVRIGVGLRKAQNLVDRYPADRIAQQLEWLPLRAARRPASLLIASIEHNYDPPVYAKD
jgi:hypothetical protein